MSEARRSKVLKLFLAILSTVFVFCMAAFVCAPAVYAEDEFSSVGDRYFHTNVQGATVESFLNKASVISPMYRGLRTEVTVPEGTENVEATFNAVVNPMEKSIIQFDIAEPRTAEADAIVVTFTALADPTKQISLISVNRKEANGDERCWLSVSLTDDLFFENGFTYITGTEQPTIGRSAEGNYDENGFTLWSYNGASQAFIYGAIFGGEYQIFLTDTGDVKTNDTTVIANVLDENYLAASRANLAGSEYAERYTAEYVQQVIDAMKAGNSDTGFGNTVMSIKYYGLKTTKVATHIRQMNGQWLTDNGNVDFVINQSMKAYALPKTDVLNAGETYTVGDLFDIYTAYRSEGTDVSFATGWLNEGVEANGDATWIDFGYNRNPAANKAFSVPAGQNNYAIKLMTYNSDNYGVTGYGPAIVYNFKVEYPIEATFSVNGEVSESIGVAEAGEITLPEAAELDGAVFLGWLANGSLYGAGAKYTLTEDTAFQAAFIEFTYDGTASVRLGEPKGIRFIAQFDKATADVLPTLNDVSYSLGMLITSEGSSKSVDIECDSEKIYSDGDYYKFNAALVNIREENLTRVYHAQPYMKITYSDGTTATINAAVKDTSGRSYAGVITAAYNDVQEEAGGEYQTEVIWNGQTRYAKCSAETYALIAELYESLPTQE